MAEDYPRFGIVWEPWARGFVLSQPGAARLDGLKSQSEQLRELAGAVGGRF
jgi:hypothetical protein